VWWRKGGRVGGCGVLETRRAWLGLFSRGYGERRNFLLKSDIANPELELWDTAREQDNMPGQYFNTIQLDFFAKQVVRKIFLGGLHSG
jgi:hypothetical protein